MEALPGLPINDHGYIGAVHIADGMPEYWIGMFFPVNTDVPNGFECVDIAPMNHAVFYLYCPRFTTPDASGNVILDYGVSIEE